MKSNRFTQYAAYALIIIIIYFVFFWRLDGALLWRDEATTACWAREMAQSNSFLPKVWNGEQLIVQGPKGHDFDQHFFPSMQGWLQFYVSALFFKLFGVNTFTARLPYAICGVIGIFILYLIFKKLLNSQRIALIAALLCMFSIPYLHFVRQSRYYALVICISLVLVYEIIKLLIDKQSSINLSLFLKLSIWGILLFLSNYFSFFMFWAAVLLSIIFVKEMRYSKGLLFSSITMAIVIVPMIYFIHSSFISRAEITQIGFLSDYRDWMILAFQRMNQLVPIIPLLAYTIFLFWRHTGKLENLKKVMIWLWIVIISTLLISVMINKSNAFLRYNLFIIPVALILVTIFVFITKQIYGIKPALVLFAALFLYHSFSSIPGYSEAVVKRQFKNDKSHNFPLVKFLKENVKPEETVAFIRNEKGMAAFFYLPDLKWRAILESENPYNQIYKSKLPATMFDDYENVDWVVVWGVLGLPRRVETGYDLVWHYRYDLNQPAKKTGKKNIYTLKQYTITEAEGGVGGDLQYYDFYRKQKVGKNSMIIFEK